jgi:TonB family protein
MFRAAGLLVKFIAVLGLALLPAQTQPQAVQQKDSSVAREPDGTRKAPNDAAKGRGPVDVLSDTDGVDVRSYIGRILPVIKDHWYWRIPESAKSKAGEVQVAFRIGRDGKISDVRYLLLSGDTVLDQAAFRGIADSNPLPALSSDYHCQDLTLAIRFYYNMLPNSPNHLRDHLIPCVKSRITLVGNIGITVSPTAVTVRSGEKQQFLATVGGLDNATVKWTVSGVGCAAHACGSISPDGLYTAPEHAPTDARVTVQATVASETDIVATATVTVAEPEGRH